MKDWVREGDRDRDIDSERGIGMREGQGQRWVGCGRDRVRKGQGEKGVGDLRWVGVGWMVGAMIKDQQGLMYRNNEEEKKSE